MNASVNQVNSLHKEYIKCVDREMSAYLSQPDRRVTEFCTAEKNEYMSAIKANFPHEYTNILRVEANTY